MKKILLAAVLVLLGALAALWLASEESGAPSTLPLVAAAAEPIPSAADLPVPAGSVRRASAERAEAEPEGEWCEVEVRTVDQQGRPVSGIPIGFGWTAEKADSEPLGVTAAPDGLASIRVPTPQPETHRFVHALMLSPQPACAELPAEATVEQPVQLVVPSVGKVRIEVADALSMFGSCVLERADGAAAAHRFGHSDHTLWTEVEDFAAEFPCVALEQRLIVSLRQRRGGEVLSQPLDGPRRAGEVVTVRFEPPPGPALIGRLLGEDGAPLGDAECHYRLLSEGLSFGRDLVTGTDGRFRISLSERSVRGDMMELTLQREIPAAQPGWGANSLVVDPSRRARTSLPALVLTDAFDLGDLVLEACPILAAGIVTDRSGAPVAGVNLHVQELIYTRADGESTYAEVEGADAVSAEDGSFQIYGDAPDAAVQLTAYSSEYLPPPPLPFTAGDQRLAVTIHRAGGVEGSVLLPAGDEEYRVTIELQPLGQGSPVWQRVDGNHEPNRFSFKPIAPGLYSCAFRLASDPVAFLVVAGIQVLEGESTRDVRLQELDLRPHLTPLSLRLRCEDGSAVPERLTVTALAPDGRGGEGVAFRAVNGVASLLLVNGTAADFAVRADGFLTEYLPDLSTDTEVVLRRAVRILLRVAGDASLVHELGPCSLRASMLEPEHVPRLVTMLGQQQEYFDLGSERTVSVLLTRTGSLVVDWMIPTTVERNGILHKYKRRQACTTLSIGPADDGREFEIPPPVLD